MIPSATPLLVPPRNTVRDTWRWLWKDTLGRVAPFLLASAAYARFSRRGARGLGLTTQGLAREAALGVVLGVPMVAVSAAFRGWVAPGYRLPTPADQALQSSFYFGLNAPAEELFWRGSVQQIAVAGLARIPALRRVAPLGGWALTTAAFGAYHRLGGWSWRSIAGVTVAGGFFGALFLARPHSLLSPILMHGFATAGFLSWGDVALHRRALRRARATNPA